MEWIENLSAAIRFIEDNLEGDICVEDVARRAYASSSHFQFIFHVVTGITVGEYVRNRRLTMAARELLQPGARIIDVAMRYGYDTQESFSKAFTRFHGVSPSRLRPGDARAFLPLTINVVIRGGFDMEHAFMDGFSMIDWNGPEGGADGKSTAGERYHGLVKWAQRARGTNPGVFDALTEWILDDSQWAEDRLAENEQVLMHGVFARFREQNARLRACLKELEPAGVVNGAAFGALDRFDEELGGKARDEGLRETVARVFADFSAMRERRVREVFAGCKTGPLGTDSVELFGYVNRLKEDDAQVQWTLFMPDVAKAQQDGFRLDSFEYKSLPALRFIGREGDEFADVNARKELFHALDAMTGYASGFDCDLLFMHHNGLGVDVAEWHGVWGRFMKADAPVPEGFQHFDFAPVDDASDASDHAGPPYYSQFAFATFSGDVTAMHRREGYDSDAMYDVTRNVILGQDVCIPYPDKYWTAEAFLNGCEKDSTGYLFSVRV